MTEDKSRPTLRQTDFLPARFSGDRLDRDESTAHFLTFTDYLDAQHISTTDAQQLPTILKVFKRTLQGQARLWIDKLTFKYFDDLKDSFIQTKLPLQTHKLPNKEKYQIPLNHPIRLLDKTHPPSRLIYKILGLHSLRMTSHHPLLLDTRHVPHMTSLNLDLLTDKTSIGMTLATNTERYHRSYTLHQNH